MRPSFHFMFNLIRLSCKTDLNLFRFFLINLVPCFLRCIQCNECLSYLFFSWNSLYIFKKSLLCFQYTFYMCPLNRIYFACSNFVYSSLEIKKKKLFANFFHITNSVLGIWRSCQILDLALMLILSGILINRICLLRYEQYSI